MITKYVYIISYNDNIRGAYSSEERLELAKQQIMNEEGLDWADLEGHGYDVTICRLDGGV